MLQESVSLFLIWVVFECSLYNRRVLISDLVSLIYDFGTGGHPLYREKALNTDRLVRDE